MRIVRAAREQRVQRAFISVLLVCALITIGSQLIFSSTLQRDLYKVTRPVATATGLDQYWGVFAPDPRPDTIWMFARIRYADGTSESWKVPTANVIVGTYWDYRWRKWLEYIANPQYSGVLWRPASVWIAQTHDNHGHRPIRVTLVAKWWQLNPPGMGQPLRTPTRETAYY